MQLIDELPVYIAAGLAFDFLAPSLTRLWRYDMDCVN